MLDAVKLLEAVDVWLWSRNSPKILPTKTKSSVPNRKESKIELDFGGFKHWLVAHDLINLSLWLKDANEPAIDTLLSGPKAWKVSPQMQVESKMAYLLQLSAVDGQSHAKQCTIATCHNFIAQHKEHIDKLSNSILEV